MNELTAVIVGLGIGFLIGLPALVVYRHDIASNIRRLLSGEPGEQREDGQPVGARRDPTKGSRSPKGTDGLSPATATFVIGAGVVTALYGAFLGGIVFLASGVFLVLSVLVALIATKAVKD